MIECFGLDPSLGIGEVNVTSADSSLFLSNYGSSYMLLNPLFEAKYELVHSLLFNGLPLNYIDPIHVRY